MIASSQSVYAYFRNKFKLKPSTNGWWIFNCPICDNGRNKRKMAVKPDWKFVKCWECEYRETAINFVMDYEDLSFGEAVQFLRNVKVSSIDAGIFDMPERTKSAEVMMNLPPGYKSIGEGDGTLAKRARSYLTKRNFDIEKLDRMGVGYVNTRSNDEDENYFGRIILPFKRRGNLSYYIGRTFIGEDPKYKNPTAEVFGVKKSDLLWNEDALDVRREIELLEGVFDAITIGDTCTASLGWSLSDAQFKKIITSKVKLVTIIHDHGYYKRALKTAQRFMGIKDVRVPCLDILGEGDVNVWGRKAVMDIAEKTPLLTNKLLVDKLNRF